MIDILYVNYNSSNVLIQSISSIINSKDSYQKNIFIWDNNSKDNVDEIKKIFPDVTLFKSKKNLGFAKGINRLLKYTRSTYQVILNPDTLITNDFLGKSVAYLEANQQLGILGPKILNVDGTIQGSARSFPTPLTSLFGRNSPITKLFPNNSITAKNILTAKNGIQNPTIVDWISGACMVVRKEAILSIGGFDEQFFLYWEDADLCKRIKMTGWDVVYFPESQVVHYVGESSNTRPIFANYQFHKSCHQLFEKHAKWPLSIISPVAGIALMLRFVISIMFNWSNRVLNRLNIIKVKKSCRKETKKNKIRVLRVISRMNIGGPSIHVKNLIENIDANKFESKLITGTISPSEGDMGYIANFKKDTKIYIPELQREINLKKDFIAFVKVLREIIRFDPHIIHSHTSKAGTVSRLSAFIYNIFKNKKAIVVHTFHGNILDGYFSRFKSYLFLLIEKLLAIVTDRIIAISESQKWELSSTYKVCNPNIIKTIKLGFDLNKFLNISKHKGTLRKKLGLSKSTIIIGIIGRIVPIKNHKMLIDSAKFLLGNFKNKKIIFLLVGDGELRSFLEDYVAECGIEDNVLFYGWERNIPLIYADLDILALTSLNEGTPVSIIEAMATKVPVITTGVGGVKDLLGKFDIEQPNPSDFKICERGILCPTENPCSFYRALRYMIESGYLCDKFRFSRAQDYVAKNYSVGRLVKDMESLYEHLVSMR